MSKKTYQELLKENLNEFDTTKTVDVKGPMLDPILGYEGDGELPTYKDAASVLERYYFGEKRSEHEITEMDYENDKGESSGESMKNTEGPEGEEQAGTSNANNASGAAKEKEKDIAKEGDESSEGEAVSEKEMNTADLKSGNMKDAEGPEDEEQAGTGNTYTDFKKRVVEAIEKIVENDEKEEKKEKEEKEGDEKEEKEGDEKEEKEGDEKEEKDLKEMKDEKDEKCEKCGKEKCECPADKEKEEKMEEAQGVVPPPSLQKKIKNEDQGEDYEDDADAKGVKEDDEINLSSDSEDITESLENEIIEKLIAEMEEEAQTISEQDEEVVDDAEGDDALENDDEDEGLDVDKKMEEMVNRLTQGPAEGPEGEEQAGTTGKEKVIPPRKDRSDEGDKTKGVKPMDKGELADA